MPPELDLDHYRIVRLLNDPHDYHWPELKASLLGALTALSADGKSHGRLRHFRWPQLLDFLACVFAAKWALDAPGNSLSPVEEGFSFPRDTTWLRQVMESFGLSGGSAPPFLEGHFESDVVIPWPSGFNPGDYPSKNSYDDLQDAQLESMDGVASYVAGHFAANPPKSTQDLIDRTIHLTGGYPLPYSVHDAARLTELTKRGRAEAMSWVWADQWSPKRLAQDLKNALLPLRLRLESVLLESSAANRSNTEVFEERDSRLPEPDVLDFLPIFRELFRRLLYHHFGDDWLMDAISIEDQKTLAGMLIENHREGADFDYAELPLFERLAKQHWAHVFEPFLIHSSGSPKTALKKPEFLKLIRDLIPIRNVAAHRRRPLTSGERRLVREVYKRLLQWREALNGYSAGRSE